VTKEGQKSADQLQMVSGNSGGLCLDFQPNDDSMFVLADLDILFW
jgi:hypothetical protein